MKGVFSCSWAGSIEDFTKEMFENCWRKIRPNILLQLDNSTFLEAWNKHKYFTILQICSPISFSLIKTARDADRQTYWVFHSKKPASWDQRRQTRCEHGFCRDSRSVGHIRSACVWSRWCFSVFLPTDRLHLVQDSCALWYSCSNSRPHAASTDNIKKTLWIIRQGSFP